MGGNQTLFGYHSYYQYSQNDHGRTAVDQVLDESNVTAAEVRDDVRLAIADLQAGMTYNETVPGN